MREPVTTIDFSKKVTALNINDVAINEQSEEHKAISNKLVTLDDENIITTIGFEKTNTISKVANPANSQYILFLQKKLQQNED